MMDDYTDRNTGNILTGQRLGEIDDMNSYSNCCSMATGDVFNNLVPNPYAKGTIENIEWNLGYTKQPSVNTSPVHYDQGVKARKNETLTNVIDIGGKAIETAKQGADLASKVKGLFKKETTVTDKGGTEIQVKGGKTPEQIQKRNLIIAGSVIGGVVLITTIVYLVKKIKK